MSNIENKYITYTYFYLVAGANKRIEKKNCSLHIAGIACRDAAPSRYRYSTSPVSLYIRVRMSDTVLSATLLPGHHRFIILEERVV